MGLKGTLIMLIPGCLVVVPAAVYDAHHGGIRGLVALLTVLLIAAIIAFRLEMKN